MSEMKVLMSSMIGAQIRAALPTATVTSALGTTTTSNVVGYGATTQPSAMFGGSPMAAASHVMGNIDTQVTPQVAMVSEEALPPPPVEEASETMVSDVESESPPADQREQVPASYMDALSAVYKYLPENICPTQPLARGLSNHHPWTSDAGLMGVNGSGPSGRH